MLVSTASLAEPSIVGSWIVHIDDRSNRDLTPGSICLTFRADGTFEFRGRMDAQRGSFVGRYTLSGNQLRLETRGQDPDNSFVEVGQDRLRVLAPDEDPDEDPGLILERTAWCE